MIYLARKRCQWKLAWSSRPRFSRSQLSNLSGNHQSLVVRQPVDRKSCLYGAISLYFSVLDPQKHVKRLSAAFRLLRIISSYRCGMKKFFRVMCDSAGHDLQRCSLRVYSVSRWPQTSSVLVHVSNQSQ